MGDIITPELIETVESKIRQAIRHEQEKICCLRKLETMAGKYVTKRIEPDIQGIFTGYKSVYLHKDQYNGKIEIVLNNPGWDYWYDAYHLTIADKERRVSADMITKQIEDAEKAIASLETLHANFREQAMQLANVLPYMKTLTSKISGALTVADRNDTDYSIRRLKDICNHMRWA